MRKSGAGKLHESYSFQKRGTGSDGYGNTLTDWSAQFTRYGARRFFRGSEKVESAASTGIQSLIIKVRSDSETRLATTGWRIVDNGSSETYNVVSVEPHTDRKYIDFVVQSGGADG